MKHSAIGSSQGQSFLCWQLPTLRLLCIFRFACPQVTQMEHIYIRGGRIRFVIVPDMLKNAPMVSAEGLAAILIVLPRSCLEVFKASC